MQTSLFTEWMYNGKWMTTEFILTYLNEELESVSTFSLPDEQNSNYERNYRSKYSNNFYF